MQNRRNFLKQASLMLAGGLVAPQLLTSCGGGNGSAAGAATEAAKKHIGLQLYSLRDDINDLGIQKVLEIVSKMGYVNIETAGYSDDGKIYETYQPMEEQGSVYQLTAILRGVDTWPDDYELVAAAFGDSPYATYTKVIHAHAREGEPVSVILSGMREVNQVEICAVNRLRKRIVTFYQTDFTLQEDTLFVDAGTLDVSIGNGVQQQVFNTDCIGCHGASTFAAANLFLTEGKSEAALVGVPSTRSEAGKLLVVPGSPDESFLMDVLIHPEAVRHDHVDILSAKPDKLTLLEAWIESIKTNL